MQFEFKNLGTIKEAQLEMGNLTIICGKNNTGKTYLTYEVWRILTEEQFDKFHTFILPVQRDSIEFFYKELNIKNLYFPQPIEKLIDFARDLTRQVIKTESFLAKEHPELVEEVENLLGVTYEVLGDEVLIKDNKDKNSTQKIPTYMASTSVRSLMHLHFWLKHKAQKGDLLMIDEPELNLHPENQIKMARLFAKLVNAGIKIWITTHSDYIIKEFNNCLMFSQEMENKKELLEELGYKENEILKRDDIRAYIARYDEKLEGCTVDKVEFDEYGMVMTTFDEQIDKINAITESLADAIDEQRIHKKELAK
jgi:predicted ATP-dependent endonuclease of OLD family